MRVSKSLKQGYINIETGLVSAFGNAFPQQTVTDVSLSNRPGTFAPLDPLCILNLIHEREKKNKSGEINKNTKFVNKVNRQKCHECTKDQFTESNTCS